MNFDFSDKVVLVTGGSTGIGLATAQLFAACGASVAVVGRDFAALAAAATACGDTTLPIQADLSTDDGCQTVADTVLKHFKKLDVLVNNAGRTARTCLAKTDMVVFDQVFNLNVRGVYNLTRLLAPALIESKGSIINVSSIAATTVAVGSLPYGMAKAALDHFTRLISVELAPKGVRVNAVSPGVTISALIPRLMNFTPEQYQEWLDKTEHRIPMKEACTSEDIAKTIVFLCSDHARLITGIVMAVDGGMRYGDFATYAAEQMK